MRKKILILVIIILIISSGIVYADELEEVLKAYLSDPSLDFLGRGYDKILFKENLTLIEDIKTMPLQLKCIYKIITQEPNIIAYGTLGGLGGLKIFMGEKEFNYIVKVMMKFLIK